MANELVPPGASSKKADVTMLAELSYYGNGKTELIDGIFADYPHGIYLYDPTHYIEFSVAADLKWSLWCHSAATYYTSPNAYQPAQILYKWNGNAFEDTGIKTTPGTTGVHGWHKALNDLQGGRYRIGGVGSYLNVEWYFESTYRDLTITIPQPSVVVPKNTDAELGYKITVPDPSAVTRTVTLTKSPLGLGNVFVSEEIDIPMWIDITKIGVV